MATTSGATLDANCRSTDAEMFTGETPLSVTNARVASPSQESWDAM